MVTQESHGESVKENVVGNLNTIFKMLPHCLGALTPFYCCDT
jgi:hypothetical protein